MKTWIRRSLLGVGVLVVVIQLVPYGRAHDNPPVVQEPAWDAPATRALAVRACFDCHSNETKWPWYSNVAPVSWLVQQDVDEGREHLNFSRWDQRQRHARDAAEELADGEMPPSAYTPAHPEARLTDAEKAALIRGLEATVGSGGGGSKGGSRRGGEDR